MIENLFKCVKVQSLQQKQHKTFNLAPFLIILFGKSLKIFHNRNEANLKLVLLYIVLLNFKA